MLYQVALLSCSKAAPKCGDQKTENTAYSVWAVQWLPGEYTGSPAVLCEIVGPPAMTSSQWKCDQGNAVVCDWLLWSVASWIVTIGVVLIQRVVIGAAVNPSHRHYDTSYWPKSKYHFLWQKGLLLSYKSKKAVRGDKILLFFVSWEWTWERVLRRTGLEVSWPFLAKFAISFRTYQRDDQSCLW